MAIITLQSYLADIDKLMKDDDLDAAIFHCQHILQQYPKNIATFQRLAQAFMRERRWNDARQVLLRVLSVYPDDQKAHSSLAVVNRNLQQHDAAIWHMERAYEQDTQNNQIAAQLRAFYKELGGQEVERLPLTTGAVARQYMRNGLLNEAITALSETLEESPQRIDLRLLLARAYREAGQIVEAAEVALDILATSPDCLEANIMLAELWLAEQRPSDAQRYLNRIEPVAPYLALRLAKGTEPEENAFVISEGDYESAANRQLIQTRPDWLEQINVPTDQPAVDLDEDPLNHGTDVTGAMAADDDLPENWSDYVEAFKDVAEEETVAVKIDRPTEGDPTVDNLFGDNDKAEAIAPEPSQTSIRRPTGLTGLLSALDDDDSPMEEPEVGTHAEPDLDSVVGDTLAGNPTTRFQPDENEEEDPLAWMQDSDVKLTEETEEPQTQADFIPSSDQADPMAWMQAAGVEFDKDADSGPLFSDPFGTEEDGELQDPESIDPLAWMQDSGIEFEGEEVSDEDNEEDPLAWMQGSSIKLVDDDVDPTHPTEVTEVQETNDNMDWLSDDSVLEEILDVEELTTSGSTGELIQPSEEQSNKEWATDMSDNDDKLQEFDWMDEEESSDETQPNVTAPLDGEGFDWSEELNSFETESIAPQMEDDTAEAEFDWSNEVEQSDNEDQVSELRITGVLPDAQLDDGTDTKEEPVAQTDADPVMTGELPGGDPAPLPDQTDYQLEEDFAFDFEEEPVAQTDADPVMTGEPSDGDPAPLPDQTDYQLEEDFAFDFEEEPVAQTDADPVMTGEPSDGDPAPLPDQTDYQLEEDFAFDFEEEPVAQTDADPVMTGELSDGDPAPLPDQTDYQLEEDFAFDFEEEPVAQTDADPVMTGELPGGDPAPLPDQTDYQLEEDFAFDFEEEPVAQTDADPVMTGELSDGDPAPLPDQTDYQLEEDFAFDFEEEPVAQTDADPVMTGELPGGDPTFDFDDEANDNAQPAAEADIPDWMSNLQPDDADALPELLSQEDLDFDNNQDDMDFLFDDEANDNAQPAAEADIPDWMSNLQPDDADALPELLSQEDLDFDNNQDDMDFLFDDEANDNAQPAAEADIPDWMSNLQPDEIVQADATLDWMVNDEQDENTPEWVSDAEPMTSDVSLSFDEELANEPMQAETPDWLSGIGTEEDPVLDAISDAPDWLSDAEPIMDDNSLSFDEALEEEEPVAADVPDWLSGIGVKDGEGGEELVLDTVVEDSFSLDADLAEAGVVADVPDWLSGTDEDEEQSKLTESPDTMYAESDTDIDKVEPTPAENAPDWLNAMVPGLDVDYEVEVDEPVENKFALNEQTQSEDDYEWVGELVEAESSPPPEALPGTTQPRFAFSRPPVWVRQSQPSHELDDVDFEEIGDELPPWLDLDE